MLREMSSQIFRVKPLFIKLTKSLIPSHVGKSLPAQFLKYFVNASSTKGSSFDQEHPGAITCYKFNNNAYSSFSLNSSLFYILIRPTRLCGIQKMRNIWDFAE